MLGLGLSATCGVLGVHRGSAAGTDRRCYKQTQAPETALGRNHYRDTVTASTPAFVLEREGQSDAMELAGTPRTTADVFACSEHKWLSQRSSPARSPAYRGRAGDPQA